MISSSIGPIADIMRKHRDYQFWFCQAAGWVGYSLVTFLTITVVDQDVGLPSLGHIAMSAILGMLTTWPLRPLYRLTFDLTMTIRVIVASIAVIVLSGVWTVSRVLVYAWIVGEPPLWHEFNYWYFGSLSIFLSWTVLYFGIKYYELLTLEHQKLLEESALKREEQFKRLQAESSERDAQLQMLRYQLNPHFLFNTLNAINALVRLGDRDKAQEMIQLLSAFLRHSLEQDDGAENVTLEQELASLMLYLNIEKVRFEDRLTLEFDIAPQARQAMVPGLILQPIIENSMKYAISESESGGTVRVEARVKRNELILEISDTGPGMDTEQLDQGRGIGLRNTLTRLETIYVSNYSFEITNVNPSGLMIRLRIPFMAAPTSTGSITGQAELTHCAS